jgi:uncharacterized damage-inducible protein DinB
VHVAAVNYLYWDYAFGPATASFDLEMPGNAAAATRWLRASQEPLIAVLAALSDSGLDTPRKTNWGEWWPCHKIFTTLIHEQVHHGAEISLLRDLYRNRGTLGSQARPRQQQTALHARATGPLAVIRSAHSEDQSPCPDHASVAVCPRWRWKL